MKYLSLFSGIGGFELGIQKAYENKDIVSEHSRDKNTEQGISTGLNKPDIICGNESWKHSPLCIGFSEIDKYAIQIYQKHFPEHKNYGDIETIKTADLPDFDLLVGGFPCQAFSIAGKRGGFNDTRGTLFFEIARILDSKRPRYFVLENVKGLLSHDRGRTFKTIISTIDELGYDCQWQVLNSKNHGVPQNRERVFIVGNLRGERRPEVFPLRYSDEKDIRKIGEEVSFAIGATYHKGINTGSEGGKSSFEKGRRQMIEVTSNVSDAQRIYDSKGIAKTLKGLGGGLGAKTGMYLTGDMKIRRLTPRECERLQGFPDDWTEGLSDTQRYKTLGNAVTVNVITHIMKQML